MPSITKVFSGSLALPSPSEPDLLINSSLFPGVSAKLIGMAAVTTQDRDRLTASGSLCLPASFRHTASTAALSVAWLAPWALVGRWG